MLAEMDFFKFKYKTVFLTIWSVFLFVWTASAGSESHIKICDDLPEAVCESPEIVRSSIDTICALDNVNYFISFVIQNGDPDSYEIVGNQGILIGNVFTSDLIPSGQSFLFVVSDSSACGSDTLAGTYTCSCLSSLGFLQPDVLFLCESDTIEASANYDPSGQIIDGNDIRNYILVRDDLSPLNNILLANTTGKFYFEHNALNFGQTYYIALIIGNQSTPSVVDLSDPCLIISEFLTVTWFEEMDEIVISTSSAEISCHHPEITLTLSSTQDTSGYQVEWSAEEGGVIPLGDRFRHQQQISVPGYYTVTVSHSLAGCVQTQSIRILQSSDIPEVVLTTPEALTCQQMETTISGMGSTEGPHILYEWTGPGVSGSEDDLELVVDIPGTYALTVRDTSIGCEITGTTVVHEDREAPVAEAHALGDIDCLTNQVSISGEGSSVGFEYTYVWKELMDTGHILGSNIDRDILVSAPGQYELEVTNHLNGCESRATVEVIYDENYIQDIETIKKLPSCDGGFDGQIVVSHITGGRRPYAFSYDGGLVFGRDSMRTNLAPGIYSLVVKDETGCTFSEEIILTAPADFFIDLGENQILPLGEEVMLSTITNLPDSLVGNIEWLPALDSVNQHTFIQQFYPGLGQWTINLTVTDANDCPQTDEIEILVKFEKRIFIPSAIHLNSQRNENRYINIYADPIMVTAINSFGIYDRWGKKVFWRQNIPVGLELNTPCAWDGMIAGTMADSGVYTYVVQVDYVTGKSAVITGEITVFQ